MELHLSGTIVADKELTKGVLTTTGLAVEAVLFKIVIEFAGCHAMNQMKIAILWESLQHLCGTNQRLRRLLCANVKLNNIHSNY